MEIWEMKPRRYGQTEANIEYMHFKLSSGFSTNLMCLKPDGRILERYVFGLFSKGSRFTVKETHTSRLVAIYDNDRFEPTIIDYKTEIQFTGYSFEPLT